MPTERQILLFTDFGPAGPYLGQMESVLRRIAPHHPVIHLLSDAPAGEPRLAGYLLAALRYSFPPASIFLCIVDPGVGGARKAVVLEADGQYFVGPDNGLLNTVAVQSLRTRWQEIAFRPPHCSASFHGRDVFAPVAAHLAVGNAGNLLAGMPPPDLHAWPADVAAIVYCDHYGNAMSGIRYSDGDAGKTLVAGEHSLRQAETFCSAAPGQAFWYCNSSGLIEIAINRGRADRLLNLHIGDAIAWQ